MALLPEKYDSSLVVLSVVIAIFAAYAALDLAGRISATRGRAYFAWLLAGAGAMGLGIWAMHYIGMLALTLPVPVLYDLPTVLLSLLAAVLSSGVALQVVSGQQLRARSVIIASLFMGAGISSMHFIGMAAMRLPAMCHYNPWVVMGSILIAIAVSVVAVLLTFRFRMAKGFATGKIVCAAVMGVAIAGMHYTGMAAVSFTALPQSIDTSNAVEVSSLGVAGITVITLVVLTVVFIASLLDRRLSVNALQLAAGEERYRLLFERSPAAIYRSTLDGVILDCNDACATILSVASRQELIANSSRIVCSDPAAWDAFVSELSYHRQLTNVEACFRGRHDREVWVLENASLVTDSSTQALVIEGTFLDISDRKEMELALTRTKELAIAASAAKSEFLATMSHEIRTPMNGVLGMAGLLLDTDLNSEQREYAYTLRHSAEALLTIINDILDFSKIEAGKMMIEPIPFDLALAIEEIADLLHAKTREKGLEFIVRYAPALPRRFIGDPGRIRQVLINLLGNAIKFTSAGHVYLNVEGVQEKSGNAVKFSVEDSGIGIPEDKLVSIFEKFTQADSSTTRRFGGTGLGLSICIRLSELMGGKLEVRSRMGEGSTFWFTLCLPVDCSTPPEPSGDVQITGLRFLQVDDNATNRFVLREQLSHWGLRNSDCSSGAEALAMLRAARLMGDPFHLAIVDHEMPDMDGETLARSIKSDPDLKDTLLVMLSSLGHQGNAKHMQEIGFEAYLLKPARPSTILDALKTVWAHSQNTAKPQSVVTRYSLAESVAATRDLLAVSEALFRQRILLAEDNPVNQMVASRMLEHLGCHVDLASDGKKAIEMIQKSAYDIVFMDCQMPVMDGYQAAAEIRRSETPENHLAIIAMTANAMQGDRERCIDAGMDDYVSKPIKKPEIIAILKRFASTGAPHEEKSAPRIVVEARL